MARGSQISGKPMQYFDCKLTLPKKGETDVVPHFNCRTTIDDEGNFVKRGNKWQTDEQGVSERSLAGLLTRKGITVGSYEYEGEEIKTVKVTVRDESIEEIYGMDFRFNAATLSFFNAFLNLDFTKENNIKVVVSQREYQGKMRSQVKLYAENEEGEMKSVGWRFEKQEDGSFQDSNGVVLPPIDVTETSSGKKIYDNALQVQFLVEELEKAAEQLDKLETGSNQNNEGSEHEESGVENQEPVTADDDLPF